MRPRLSRHVSTFAFEIVLLLVVAALVIAFLTAAFGG
jgi:hypothetical protein